MKSKELLGGTKEKRLKIPTENRNKLEKMEKSWKRSETVGNSRKQSEMVGKKKVVGRGR
jgi:hypothetical protein